MKFKIAATTAILIFFLAPLFLTRAQEPPTPPIGAGTIVTPTTPKDSGILPLSPTGSAPIQQKTISEDEMKLPPPPIGSEPTTQPEKSPVAKYLLFALFLILILVIAVFLIRRRQRKNVVIINSI